MMNKKIQNFAMALLIGNMAMSSAFAQSQADAPKPAKGPNFLERVIGIDKQAVLDPKLEEWFLIPGLKGILYTQHDWGKTIDIESDGKSIRFTNCECNEYPNCPPLLDDSNVFTAREILTRTSTWKGKRHMFFEILAGILFVDGQDIPGLPGFVGKGLEAAGFLGSSMDPMGKERNEKVIGGIAKQMISNAMVGVKDNTNPVAGVEVDGSFEDMRNSITDFLLTLGKSDAGPNQHAQTCDKEILARQDLENAEIAKLITAQEATQSEVQSTNDEVTALKAQVQSGNDKLDEVLRRLPPAQPVTRAGVRRTIRRQ